ncbi:MAG TPA: hypothetical protein VIK22_06880, partial [Candidatus Anoxymicrobiaceae bacterium]
KEHIDISHMKGQGWSKEEKLESFGWNRIPLEEIMVKNSTYTNTHLLKMRLIAAGLKKPACEACGLAWWNGKRISLELDHINGDRFDHRLENLRLLCPNVMLRPPVIGARTRRMDILVRLGINAGMVE